MNYRRKKISMKERLDEAIQEICGEVLQGSGFGRETPEETPRDIEPAAQTVASQRGDGRGAHRGRIFAIKSPA
jgi:hypothetical protein